MRILVLGGFGNFGARICRALARADLEVVAASRDPDRGHERAGFNGKIGKARVDLSEPQLASSLRRLSPHTVVHCAGPFQGQDYRVALAALEAGANYIDLADGRSFVDQFAEHVDRRAKAAERLAVSGASTVPALSGAVVDAAVRQLRIVDEIQICIAPAQRAPRGAATMAGVLSYAGARFTWWKDRAWQAAVGWQELRRIQVPGLGTRWAAACDVPDLALFPVRYPTVKTVQFRAALEVSVQHFVLAAVAELRRWRLKIPLERWAPALDRWAHQLDRFGSETGGMLISVTGMRADGRRCRVDWSVVAPDNHGPEIPCMPALLLVRKLLRGSIERRGAMPCLGLLTLDEFTPEFERWGMQTRLVEIPIQ